MSTERRTLKPRVINFLIPQRLRTASAQFAVDIVVLTGSFVIAYLLRFEFALGPEEISNLLHQLPYVLLLQIVALRLVGINNYIWRFIGMNELKSFLIAAASSSSVMFALRIWLPESMEVWIVPFSITIIDTILTFGGLLAVRIAWRTIFEFHDRRARESEPASHDRVAKRTLVIGAGRVGIMAAREIQNRSQRDFDIRGFVDDDPNLRKAVSQGVPVIGTTADLPRLVALHEIDQVIIAIAEVSRPQIKRITSICDAIPVKVQIIPAMYEILEGKVNYSRIRDVQIEDLLGRDPVHLDQEQIQGLVTDRVALVTGAGGSIGSELARQVARFNPSTLLLVERAEPALFSIDRELRDTWPGLNIVPLMADVGDRERMQSILATYYPAIVLHAAAHKHVPLMEANPGEAIKNNVLATHHLVEQVANAGVEVFVLISTDKAVKPRSVMGATKRMAELVVQSFNGRYPTRFVAVRFGNVIGSAGSVIPIFREQIKKGGPVTVTHPDMVRYFMTIPEASQLVLQAAAIGEGGEIFVLDMGEPVKIVELAKDTIRLSGLKPDEDIEIVFTGLRPGEKLFEELEIHGEGMVKTKHPKIFTGKIATMPPERVDLALRQLAAAAQIGGEAQMRALLDSVVPEADLSPVSPGTTADQVPTAVRAKILPAPSERSSGEPITPSRAS